MRRRWRRRRRWMAAVWSALRPPRAGMCSGMAPRSNSAEGESSSPLYFRLYLGNKLGTIPAAVSYYQPLQVSSKLLTTYSHWEELFQCPGCRHVPGSPPNVYVLVRWKCPPAELFGVVATRRACSTALAAAVRRLP